MAKTNQSLKINNVKIAKKEPAKKLPIEKSKSKQLR